MSLSFTCPYCGLQTEVADSYLGQSGPCAGCGRTVTVPSDQHTPVASSSGSGSGSRSTAITIIVALVAAGGAFLVVIGLITAMLLPSIGNARAAARRAQCSVQLIRIAAAFNAYHDAHGNFPPAYTVDEAGKPMHSWRVLLLPYLGAEGAALYRQYDLTQPWDSPTNAALTAQMPQVYACPEDPGAAFGETAYVVVTGPGTLFEGDKHVSRSQLERTDSASQVLLVIEASGAGIGWLEPRDLTLVELSRGINAGGVAAGSLHSAGVHVVFADGSVHFLGELTSPEELMDLATYRAAADVAPPGN